MPTLTWQALGPYLDQALTMNGDDRSAWLEHLAETDPSLARQLREVLDDHRALSDEGFLERPPATLIGAIYAGQTIGAYKVISPIGQGGMSTVWLAERSDGRFEARAAIKFLNVALSGAGGHERFKREGSILGRLQHPHIAHLMDAGITAARQPYLVLEYVEGEQIDQYCERLSLDVRTRVERFLDVVSAVAHAHANLIVHRDIKPSNVLVTAGGQVKLLDFGIAKLLEDETSAADATQLTRDAGNALTPLYAAPEQLTRGPINTATDVYALGVLLYVLLTGRHPAGRPPLSHADLVKAIIETEPPRMSDAAPDRRRHLLRGDLDTIASKALQKDPHQRYVSVTAFGEDLRRYLQHDPIRARPDTFAYRAAKFVRRNRSVAAVSTLAIVAAAIGLVATLLQARASQRQRDFAFRQLARAEQINSLNHFLLADAAPAGAPVSISGLLARAEHIVERENYAGKAAAHVEVLMSIGEQYSDSDDNAKALAVLQKAYDLSRGLNEPSVRARAACALAMPMLWTAQRERAESLVQEGLGGLPPDPEFVLDRAVCLVRATEVALLIGGPGAAEQAITRAQSAEQAMSQAPFQSGSLKLEMLTNLASAYHLGGRFDDALAAYERAVAQMSELGYDDTRTAQALLHDWGLETSIAGRPVDAERIYRRALDITSSNQADEAAAAALLNDYAGVLRELGRSREAIDYAERAYTKAGKASQQFILAASMIQRVRVYRDIRDFARCAEILAELEPLLRRTFPAGHYAFASFAFERALLEQAQGRVPAALQLADQAVALDEEAIKRGGVGAFLLPTLLIRRSEMNVEVGRVEAAVADATRALNLLQAPTRRAGFSQNTGRAFLALARAFHAQGRRDEARDAARSAENHLRDAVGEAHPETVAAHQLAGDTAK